MPRTPSRKPRPVTFAVARRLALALPCVAEGTSYRTPAFKIAGKFFFRLREDAASLAVRIDFDTRDALLKANPKAFFITDHYKGYPAVCVLLSAVGQRELKLLLDEAWRFCAPPRVLARQERKPPASTPLPAGPDHQRQTRGSRARRAKHGVIGRG